MNVGRIHEGLWWWSTAHPSDPRPAVCAYLEIPGHTVVIDPVIPADPAQATRFFRAFDRDVARRGFPVTVLLTGPDPLDSNLFVDRHNATVWGPSPASGLDVRTADDGGEVVPGIVAHDVQVTGTPRRLAYVCHAHRVCATADLDRSSNVVSRTRLTAVCAGSVEIVIGGFGVVADDDADLGDAPGVPPPGTFPG